MLDHQEARMRADHHAALGRAAGDLIAGVRDTFETLAAIRYDAPWRRDPRRTACKN